jgi:predicted RNA-binding Zn-ribbon protein involved in translation (DUF1610 family)
MTTMLDDAHAKIEAGVTTCEEVLRVFGPQNTSQITCVFCGSYMEQRHHFCPYCGKELIERCKQCDQLLTQDWCYCPSCGHLVDKDSKAQKQI